MSRAQLWLLGHKPLFHRVPPPYRGSCCSVIFGLADAKRFAQAEEFIAAFSEEHRVDRRVRPCAEFMADPQQVSEVRDILFLFARRALACRSLVCSCAFSFRFCRFGEQDLRRLHVQRRDRVTRSWPERAKLLLVQLFGYAKQLAPLFCVGTITSSHSECCVIAQQSFSR